MASTRARDVKILDSWKSSIGLFEIREDTGSPWDRMTHSLDDYYARRGPLINVDKGRYILEITPASPRTAGSFVRMIVNAFPTMAKARKGAGEAYRYLRTSNYTPEQRAKVPVGKWGETEREYQKRSDAARAKEQAKVDRALATCGLTWDEQGQGKRYLASAQGRPYDHADPWDRTSYLISWMRGYRGAPDGYAVTYVYPPTAAQLRAARRGGIDIPEREDGVGPKGAAPSDHLFPQLTDAKQAAEDHCRKVSGIKAKPARAKAKRSSKGAAKPKAKGKRWRWSAYRQGGTATSYSPISEAGIMGQYRVHRYGPSPVSAAGPHFWAVTKGSFREDTYRTLLDGYATAADAKVAAQIHQESGHIPSPSAFQAKAKAPTRSSGKSAGRKSKTMSANPMTEAQADKILQRIHDAMYIPGAEDEPWDHDTLTKVKMILLDTRTYDLPKTGSRGFLREFDEVWSEETESIWDSPEDAAPVLHRWKAAKAKAKPKRKATKKKASKAKPANAASGPTLCCLEWSPAQPDEFLWRSRGGTGAHSKTAARGTSRTGSRFYKIDLAVLIERMGKMGLRAEKIAVDTRALKDVPLSKRTIARDVKLPSSGVDANELRSQLGSKGAKVGRPPGAKGGGNTTRSLRFYLSRPLTAAEVRKLDREPTKAELDTAGKKAKRKATKKKTTKKKTTKKMDYSYFRYVAIDPKTQRWGRGVTIGDAKANAGARTRKMLVYRMPDGTVNPYVDQMGTLQWEWKSPSLRNEESPVGGNPWIVERPPVPRAKKTAKKKTAKKKTESKVEKATYLSFEEAAEFNKAVVRLLGSMDAPKTTTIDASSLQIRIPMAKTTAGVQKLVKGLRSGSDRAKFRVHNPHPPREFVVVGKGTGKLGEKIKRYREKRDISRKDLAKVMLIESSTLGQIERGSIKCPPYARLDRAADKLGVKTSTLTAAAACDYRTKKARKASKKKKKATRATPVAKDRCARKGSISTKSRDRLPAKAFGLPELRGYPMFKMGGDGKLVPSATHASNAKARAKQALDRGNLSRKDYERIVRKANKVLAQCSAPVRRAKKKAKKSARAKARRLCPADQRKILNRALREMM